jgi:hypothetical protein
MVAIIRARLREPSTWAGFGSLYLAVELALSSGLQAAAPAIIAAVVAVLASEGKPAL